MIGSTPRFPAFDDWQRMSESEQDALIAKLETARWRRSMMWRLLLGFACGTAAIVIALEAFKLWR
jgi:hypothetical protein